MAPRRSARVASATATTQSIASDETTPAETSVLLNEDGDEDGAAGRPVDAAGRAPDSTETKQPPPEKPSDVRRRVLVILSFWLIVALLGLPIWWYTTTIYRANLPLEEMMEWADGKACRPVFPLRISVQAPSLQDAEANHLLRLTQHALDDLNDFSGHHLRLEMGSSSGAAAAGDDAAAGAATAAGDEVALRIRLTPGEAASTPTASLHPHAAVLGVSYPPTAIPSLSSSSSTLATFIAMQLRSTFAEEQAVISYLLSSASASASGSLDEQQQQQLQQQQQQQQQPQQQSPRVPARSTALTPEAAEALSKRMMRAVKYAPTYHLTFSLFTAGAAPSRWDIEAAIAEYMQPILDVLGPIHNFTMDTQVQLYAAPGVQAQVLSKEDLSSFINAAEWPLSPSIGGAPTINFVVYVGNQTIAHGSPAAAAAAAAAAVDDEDAAGGASRSWLIPQWGSVYLLALGGAQDRVTQADLKEPVLTFTAHLLSLLGTPPSGSLPLRLSTLSRIRSADLLLRASSTLGSLARLSLALGNMAIPWSVAEGVASTMRHLRLACEALGGPEGLAHARIAEAEAERAFFEKSMVGQLYFPDEHKVAVYLPLLGPVGVPLVMGMLNELKAWRRRRKEKAAAAAAAATEGETKKTQ